MRGLFALLAVPAAVACGAAGDEAPPYADPGPGCPTLHARLDQTLRTLESGRTEGLRRLLETGLDDRQTGRLVEVVASLLATAPDAGVVGRDALATAVASATPALSRLLDAVAASPELGALGPPVTRTAARCGFGPAVAILAEALDSPAFPALLEAARATGREPASVDAVRAALFSGEAQRRTFPALGQAGLCFLRDPTMDLEGLVGLLRGVVGSVLDEEPLASLVDAALAVLGPGTALRVSLADWAGCLAGSPLEDGLMSCPVADRMPDADGVILRVVWDGLASDALLALTRGVSDEGLDDDPVLRHALAGTLRGLVATPGLAQAWSDILPAVATSEHMGPALRDVAALLDEGVAAEWVDALVVLQAGCP